MRERSGRLIRFESVLKQESVEGAMKFLSSIRSRLRFSLQDVDRGDRVGCGIRSLGRRYYHLQSRYAAVAKLNKIPNVSAKVTVLTRHGDYYWRTKEGLLSEERKDLLFQWDRLLYGRNLADPVTDFNADFDFKNDELKIVQSAILQQRSA